ncbi:hypothetical protein EYR41_008544 [Orbilia oligospora]|uniref:Uncharacterized protein n=1 Tax=Orbilia oligospora TaxID=2813651 RepID=A0A7C8PB11_ORBOL|nr:hypothetical protein TWF751_009117 [Orbilia oligospora]KAF3249349.1 hypothetical protein TWF128_007786 [Orbilia oligospora]KAF3249351.1 hypothetical protein TWF128_007786 [Orbilia oligospora]TGJ66957.1 hypothetical protein EYR41_008544 [Orbilia oligospora]
MSSIPPNQPYAQNPFGGQQQQRQQLPPNQQLQQYYQQKARTPSLPNTGGPSNYVDQGLSPGQFQALPQDYGPGFSSPSPGRDEQLSDDPDPSKLSGFFKNISFGNRTTKDGQPAKRRGPKPDSKPAQTRRQELNRQAQRTHRERKEAYLRQLESEITRLREAFSIVTKEKTSLTNENAELKKFLALHGLSWPPDPSIDPTSALAPAPIPPPPPVALGSMPGIPASLVGAQPLAQLVTAPSTGPSYLSPTGQYGQPTTSPNVGGAFDAIGIDFVLALERPCMEHIQKLVHDSLEDPNGTSISGHALMASCPPESHMLDNPDIDWGSRTYDLQPSELNMLLNLSPKLGVSGEVTPINAWAIIQSHPNFLQLTRHDFAAIKNELVPKVKCYGFGAVLEEYMVEDALDAVFAAKYALANQRVNNSHYSF